MIYLIKYDFYLVRLIDWTEDIQMSDILCHN